VVFAAWYAAERTLSIHTIFTSRREAFYWLAVLFTFALGTAAGDLTAERLSLGYLVALLLFAGAIAAVAVAHYVFKVGPITSFWIAYILTRPLGASIGDYLSQRRADGGLGLGTTVTSFLFLAAILVVVVFLTITRKDVTEIEAEARHERPHANILVVAHRTATTPALLTALHERAARGIAGFHLLVPNPSETAEITDHERRRRHEEGEQVLALALPLLDEIAAGAAVEGSVSVRHDPMDAIEEILRDGAFDEVMLSTLPRSVSGWLRANLPDRIAHLGVPVTTVVAAERSPAAVA
jgi:hypothetical protein